MGKNIIIVIISFFLYFQGYSQCKNVYTFDFSASADTSYSSPAAIMRNGNCCNGANCVSFQLKLNPKSDVIKFSAPQYTDASYYTINCGPQIPLGTSTCISGLTDVTISFCKPGNEMFAYTILVSSAKASADLIIRKGCSGVLSVTGLQAASTSWTSVFPGAEGDYNSYLSCTSGCTSSTVTPEAGSPAYIDYKVSGIQNSVCTASKTDTVRVYTVPPLTVDILPANPSICSGHSVTLTASVSGGGNPPYTYLWNTGARTPSITVNDIGTYNVTISDNTTCSPVKQSITVTSVTPPASITAGSNTPVCQGSVLNLSAPTYPGATYSWTGPNFSSALQNPSISNVTASAGGTYSVTVNLGGCTTTAATVVNIKALTLPASITGANNVCAGATTALTDATTGGTWSCDNTAIATVNAGVVTGIKGGNANIFYTTTTNGCTATVPFSFTVNALPVPVITPNYCAFKGKIQFTAGGGGTYLWSTGATTATILIDIAGTYSVTVTNGAGCSASASVPAATELVTDGSFTNFNASAPSFSTSYIQNQDYYNGVSGSGLYPEGYYAVNTNAYSNYPGNPQGYHKNFHGRDHTNNAVGSRNFMMVNGKGSPDPIWIQTVPVTPNTDYYFSAWAMNLNPGSPARLRFEVNGVQVGTIAELNAAAKPADENSVSLANWIRFYSDPVWNSGTATTATIRIINLNTTAGGNDFGIDDISFGTLAPIPYTISPKVNGNTSATICAAQTINLTTNLTGGRTPVTFAWIGPNGFTSTDANPSIPAITAANAGTYTVSVTDGYGCAPVTGSVSVAVNPLPAATISYGANPYCPTGSATVTQTGQGGGTYSSTPGLSINAYTGSINLADSKPGIYTVSYAYTNGICSNVTTTGITINPLPVVSAIAGTGSVCAGSMVTLTDETKGGEWSSSATDVATIDNKNGIVKGVASGSTTISYSVTVGGCTASVTFPFNVNALPAVAAIGGNKNICVGASGILSNVTPGGSWGTSDLTIATVTKKDAYTSQINGVGAGTATITYTITDGSTGCSTSVTTSIIVNGLPSAGTITGNTDICAGSVTTLNETVPGGKWSISDVSVATVTSAGVVTAVAAGTATIYYTVVNSTTSCSASASYPITVQALPAPPAAIAGPVKVCIGSSITLTDVTKGGVWSSSNTAIATIDATTGEVKGVVSGDVVMTYSVSNSNACTSSVSYPIKVNSLPGVAVITGNSNVCVGATTQLSDATASGAWTSSNTGIAGISSGGLVTGVSAGGPVLISYTITDGNSCSSTATFSMTVNPLPVATISYGTNPYCQTGSAAVTQTGQGGGTYSSTAGLSISASTGSINLAASTPGSYVISYVYTNGICSNITTANITINPLPVVSAIAGAASVCAVSSVSLTDATPGGVWSSSVPSVATINTSGIVTGVTSGTTTISYTVTGIGGCTASVTHDITVYALPEAPAAITGPTSVCSGYGISLSDATPGGKWSSSNSTVATVDAIGSVTGVSAGSVIISYTLKNASSGCTNASTLGVTVNPMPVVPPITVSQSGCTTTFSNVMPGGKWSSSNTSFAAIDPITGVVTVGAPGSATITYTVTSSGCQTSVSYPFEVYAVQPNTPILGDYDVCAGLATITLTDATAGGLWSSSDPGIATVDASGVVTGIKEGVVTISYIVLVSGSCQTTIFTRNITVKAVTAVLPITGISTICTGASTTLLENTPGGVWGNSNTSLASVTKTSATSAIVTAGSSAGQVVISYSVLNADGCPTVVKFPITINDFTPVSAITGATSVCVGSVTTLTDVTGGGVWSSSNMNIATVDANSGVVKGIQAGTVTISYTVTNAGGCTTTVTRGITVNGLPDAGKIEDAGNVCVGSSLQLSNPTAPTGTGISFVWSSGDNGAVTVDGNGLVTGISKGKNPVVISYTLTDGNGCTSAVTVGVVVNPLPVVQPIDGINSVCVGSSTTLTDATGGGNWSGSDASIASVDVTSGKVTGVKGGGVTVYYSYKDPVSHCQTIVSYPVKVYDLPPVTSITGTDPVCAGRTAVLTASNPGGEWSSTATDIATVGSQSGIVTGNKAGSVVISYLLTTASASGGCSAITNYTFTVNGLPDAGKIEGAGNVCVGSSVQLNNPTAPTGTGISFVWSSGDNGVATVNGSGLVTGISKGENPVAISYTLTDGNHCTSVVTTGVVVNPLPVVQPIDGTKSVCVGSVTSLTDVTGGGVWSSNNTNIATVDANSGVVKGIQAGTVTISYTVTNAGGCTTTVTRGITVNGLPDAGKIEDAGNVCVGSSLQLSNPTAPTGTGISFVWSSGDNGVAAVDGNGLVKGISKGKNPVVISYTLTDGNGCTSAVTAGVVVNPLPVVQPIDGINSVCVGSSTILTDATGGGKWDSDNQNVARTATDGTISGVTVGNVMISYTVKDINGCSASVNYPFVVNAYPDAGSISGESSVCVGSTITLSNSIHDGAWTSSDPSLAFVDISTGTLLGLKPGTVTISYSVTSLSGCTTSVNAQPIKVNPLPVASFASMLSESLCETSGLTVFDSTNIKLNHDDAAVGQYQWYINNSLVGVADYFPTYLIDKKLDQIAIKLITTSKFGCKSDSMVYTHSLIHPPAPSFSINDSVGCGPLLIKFTNTTPGLNRYSYQWDFGNGATSTMDQPSDLSYAYSQNGADTTYTITLKAFSSCDTLFATKNITVKRTGRLLMDVSPLTGCSPMKVVFKNNSVGDNVRYSLWLGDSTHTVMDNCTYTHIYHTGLNSIYYAKLIGENSCGADSISVSIAAAPNAIKPDIFAKDSAICGNAGLISLINKTVGVTQYDWDFGDGTPVISSVGIPDSISHPYTQQGMYTINIHLSDGCSDTTIQRTIHIDPVPSVDFTVSSQDVCIGDSVYFQPVIGNMNSISWNFGDGVLSSLYNPVHAYKNANTFNVSLKIQKTYSDNNSCYDSIQKPVKVGALKPGNLSVSDTVIRCLPYTVKFINHNLPSDSTRWNFGDGNSAVGDTVTHVFTSNTPNGIYTASMLAYVPSGCILTDNIHIRVASPEGVLQFNNNINCTKGPITFNAITNNADSVRWDFGDGTAVSSYTVNTPVYHTYPAAGVYLPKAWLSTVAGCNIVKDLKDTVKIEVDTVAFGLSVLYTCGKTRLDFIDSSHAFFGINDWSWNIADSITTGQNNTTKTFNVEGAYPAMLTITGKGGCVDSVKTTINVHIYQYPKVSIDGIAAVCKESLINLKSDIKYTDSVMYRLWDLGNGVTATDSIVHILYHTAGNYQVKLTVGTINKCFDSAYKQLTIYPLPVINLDKTYTLCRGKSIDIQPSGATNYIWKDENNTIISSGSGSINVAPLQSVQYKVIGYNQYGCSQIDSTVIKVIQPFEMTTCPNDSICKGSGLKLYASGADTYNWYPADNLSSTSASLVYASPATTTTYRIIGKDKYNCFADTSFIKVAVGTPTGLNIGRDTILQAGTNYTFNPVLTSDINEIKKWSWKGISNISCIDCPNPQARVVYDGCINCTITNSYGCQTSDTVCFKTFCPTAVVFVPNAFTPDGDGINDKLVIQVKGIKLIKSLRIFNRWGEVVFARSNFLPGDPANEWDGKIRGKNAPADVFVYVLEVICEKDYPSVFTGNIAIIK